MIHKIIKTLVDRRGLSQKQAFAFMEAVMEGTVTPSQLAAFLIGLRIKGETIPEIAGCALAMRKAANPLALKTKNLVDICGTGGDDKGTINISTAAAFVVAGAGFSLAKHGNRSISSKCGSADVLFEMGIKIDCPVATTEHCLNTIGIGFLFAPQFHPAMKYAMPTRKELAIRTVFNILGPLTNPARANVQMIGVFQPSLTNVMAQVMGQMGHKAGLSVHSKGYDEILLDRPVRVSELFKKKIKTYTLNAKDFGLPAVAASKLKGGNAAHNARLIKDILDGKNIPAKHVIIANAAALIWMARRAYGHKKIKLKEAVKQAEESISSGRALDKYKALETASNFIE